MVSLIAWIALIWVSLLVIGAVLGSIGKLIWLAILLTVAVGIWKYIQKKNIPPPFK